MTTPQVPTLYADAGHRLVTHSSPGLAAAAQRVHEIALNALERPRPLAAEHLVGSLRSFKTDATAVRLAWTESEDGGIRDDRLTALARQLEDHLDALIAAAQQADQAARQPDGQDAARAGLLDLAGRIVTLKLWLGSPRE